MSFVMFATWVLVGALAGVLASLVMKRGGHGLKTDVTLGGESYPSVYVAEMWLDWSYDDGVFRPVTRAHRIVVMTPRGKVLRVEGDGGADEDVSMSKRRGIGKETRRSR